MRAASTAILLKTPTVRDSLACRDFAHFKCLLALAQQMCLLLSEGDGTDEWQESAEDASRLSSQGAASARLWPIAIAWSDHELHVLQKERRN